ncbi:solute carrier family 35 member f5 [Quercus suber]|uniref:Solute carrier family 35 member f5 n=1 Tax=Quercus suber TaxID=58331 RepID=A0AAW0KWD6_QUESU
MVFCTAAPGIFTAYEHPFVVTYLGISLLAAYLPIAFIRDCLQKFLRRSYQTCQTDDNDVDESSMTLDSPTNNCQNIGNLDIEQQQPLADEKCIKDLHSQKEGKLSAFDNKEDVDILIHQRKLSTKEIAKLSLVIGPIWFLSETSVASTTILFSTSGLFTLLISALLGEDSINLVNLVSVFVSMAGVAMTIYGKTREKESQSTTSLYRQKPFYSRGFFALLSAVTDGLFAVLLKNMLEKKEKRWICKSSLDILDCSPFVALECIRN